MLNLYWIVFPGQQVPVAESLGVMSGITICIYITNTVSICNTGRIMTGHFLMLKWLDTLKICRQTPISVFRYLHLSTNSPFCYHLNSRYHLIPYEIMAKCLIFKKIHNQYCMYFILRNYIFFLKNSKNTITSRGDRFS